MSVNMSKERVVREGVKWIRENLPEKTVKEISDTIEPMVKNLAYNAHRFSREQDSKIHGKHIYRGKTFAFFLRVERNWWFGKRRLTLGPKGVLQNAEAFAKHGVTRGMFGTSTKNMVLGAIFIPPGHPNTAVDCTSFSNNIAFMIYKHPARQDQRKQRVTKTFENRWSFRKPKYFSYCDDDVFQDQLDSNESILKQKGF